jgi:hypothetical protein
MDQKSLKFKYIFSEDYNPTYVNGAWGGVNPQGEIVANFYMERLALPNSQTQSINQDGKLSGVIESDPKDLNQSFVRFVKNGIIMNLQSAKSIHSWLGGLIEQCEEAQKNKK